MNPAEIKQEIAAEVSVIWETVVQVCNRVLHHAELYGFHFMDMPEPNVEQFVEIIDAAVCPVLDALIEKGYLGNREERKLINVQVYILHLREIVLAIKANDEILFAAAVEKLSKEAMIIID